MTDPVIPIVRRHGLKIFFGFCFARALRKALGIEFCKISQSTNVHSYEPVEGYSMLVIHTDHPCPAGHPAYDAVQAFVVDQAVALGAGHYAVLTLFGSDVVGHNFYALSPVPVSPGVTFVPGGEHFYSYGAATAESHRGKRLSPARWTFFRDWRDARDLSYPTISYIALDNLASLASGTNTDSKIIGYSAWRRGAKGWCYRSPGASRRGVGFKVLAG